MTRKTRNVLLLLAGIYCVPFLLVGGVAVFLALRPLPPLVALPNPNAYDDLVKAGGLVSGNSRNYTKMKTEELRPLVATNAAALRLAREVLGNPCRVPVQYSQAGQRVNAGNYGKLRLLSQAFAAEARLAGLDRRAGKAAECDMDLIRLGADAARGGILNDALFGIGIRSTGAADLTKWINQLDARTCRDYAGMLGQLDAEMAPWPEVLKQETGWVRRTFGWISPLVEVIMHRQLKRVGPRLQRNYNAQVLNVRRVTINLAARAFELDKGRPPAGNAELVPDYLQAVPKHPTTGKPL